MKARILVHLVDGETVDTTWEEIDDSDLEDWRNFCLYYAQDDEAVELEIEGGGTGYFHPDNISYLELEVKDNFSLV